MISSRVMFRSGCTCPTAPTGSGTGCGDSPNPAAVSEWQSTSCPKRCANSARALREGRAGAPTVTIVDIDVLAGSASDVDELGPLWIAMVEHHRELVGPEWPVRGAEQAWALCRQEYRECLDEARGLLFLARLRGSGEPVGYIYCRLVARTGPSVSSRRTATPLGSTSGSVSVLGSGRCSADSTSHTDRRKRIVRGVQV